MASFTFSSVADTWPAGTTVNVYARKWDGTATGDSVTSAAVESDGSLELTGLVEDTAYVATANSRSKGFQVSSTQSAGSGGQGLPSTVLTKTANYTAAASDFVQVDATGGAVTITLPAAPATGALVSVKKIDGTTNQVTIAPSGGGTIDGDANASTVTEMAGAIFEHVGSNVWRIVASMATTGPAGVDGTDGTDGTDGIGVPPGGTTGKILTKASSTDYDTIWADAPGGGGGGAAELLAYCNYDVNSFASGAGALSDVDATNVKVTFTVPASGRVLVRLTGGLRVTAGDFGTWGLRENTTNVVAGRQMTSSANIQACSAAFVISGLTPGATKTYKWAIGSAGGSGTQYLTFGGTNLPLVMEAWSA